MGKDKILGPGFIVVLLASLTIGAVYWTTVIVEGNDNYFYVFSSKMDYAISQAYGRAWKEVPEKNK